MDKSRHGRRDRLVQEKRHDTYKEWGKWSEPTACIVCGALFLDGRWSWKAPPADANRVTCPACQRVADSYPAGYVVIKGPFFVQHREDLVNLIRNEEEQEKGEHPMERIISIEAQDDHTVVTTTGIHMARRIGEALSKAYQGDLSLQYGDAEKSLRVHWSR